MARARNIKPAFFLNTDLSEIEPLGRLAFIGLWTIADYKGCLIGNFKKIKAQILPYDDCNIESLMNNLEQFRFIRYYYVQGVKYIKILNFERHQNPHKNERDSGSDIPDIEENDNIFNELTKDGTSTDKVGSARADSLLLIPDSLNTDSLIPESHIIDSPMVSADKSAATKKETELQLACKETWLAYSVAYSLRYGIEPIRNQKVNSQIKQFVGRVGFKDAPLIAGYYLSSNSQYYVRRGHSADGLLSDAEKLRTEWATGKSVDNVFKTKFQQIQENNRKAGEEFLRDFDIHNEEKEVGHD